MEKQYKKTIIISEDTQRMLKEEMEMTEYKFKGSVKRFLHDLLQDPVTAEPGNVLTLNGLKRARLIKILIKKGILEKHMTIVDKNADGETMEAKMKVSFKVPKPNSQRSKQEFDKKLKKLYIELFEKNVPKKKDVNESMDIFTPNEIDRLIGNNRGDQIEQMENDDIAGKMVNLANTQESNLNESTNRIIAYHGTPHNFIKFTTSNIGGGEGNQSFGWGLYFTDNKDIATFYAKTYGKEGIGYVYTVELNVNHLFPWYEEIPEDTKRIIVDTLKNKGITELPLKYMFENGRIIPRMGTVEDAINFYPNGKFFYENMKYYTKTDESTSKFLHSLGFDGIRYYANSFRKKNANNIDGENYVIFSEDNVSIINVETIKAKIDECTAGGAVGAGPGVGNVYSDNPSGVGFISPMDDVQRRDIYPIGNSKKKKKDEVDEATTTANTGEYQYTVPFPVDNDDPTMKRHTGVGGSESINIAENK